MQSGNEIALFRLHLKHEVERKFGRKFLASSDCRLLADDVFKKTNIRLSFNTVRRFFDLLKSDSLPSLHTLDTLAEYCGYSSFSQYCSVAHSPAKNNNSGPRNDVLEYMTLLFKKIESNPCTDFSFFQFVQQTISYLDDHRYLIDFFHQNISKTANGLSFYFECFVNVDMLNSFYGDGLKYYLSEKKTEEAQVFGKALLCLKCWLSMDHDGVGKYYEQIKTHTLIINSDPVVWARYFAAQLLYHDVHKMENAALLYSMRQYHQHIGSSSATCSDCYYSFELVVAEILVLTQEFDEALYYIQKEKEKRLHSKMAFVELHFIAVIKLIEAMALAGIGDQMRSRALFEKIDPERFCFLSQRYYSIMYHALKLSLFKSTAHKQMDSFITHTGFLQLTKQREILEHQLNGKGKRSQETVSKNGQK